MVGYALEGDMGLMPFLEIFLVCFLTTNNWAVVNLCYDVLVFLRSKTNEAKRPQVVTFDTVKHKKKILHHTLIVQSIFHNTL